MNSFILAFETSCDDCCCSVVDTNYRVLSNVVSSQDEHQIFGGVVPEIASRAHLSSICDVMQLALTKAKKTLGDIDCFAVSTNPGLVGSLVVGLSFAKALAFSQNKPLVCVNHLQGHICSLLLEKPSFAPPFLALVVSGGHTHLVDYESQEKFTTVGRSVDDAAGEAFDKAATMLGLGFPGGVLIDNLAKDADEHFFRFPRARVKSSRYNFSFSGLKTAIFHYLQSKNSEFIDTHKKDIAASIQRAIVEPLVSATLAYAKENRVKKVVVAGGVSANSRLRSLFYEKAPKDLNIVFPNIKYCTDNAAMIAAAAVYKFKHKSFSDFSVNAFSTKGIRTI